MGLIEAGRLHRVALAVADAGVAEKWFEQTLGAGPLGTDRKGQPGDTPSTARVDDLEGTDTRLFRLGGYPIILLSKGAPGGPVAKFLDRYGPGVHSLAWEVSDMWTTQNLLIRNDIGIGAVNIPGRHFFMHPRDTHSLLLEWTDDSFGANSRRPDEGGGAIDVDRVAWVTAAVPDAEETAAFLADLCGAKEVHGNPRGPDQQDLIVDTEVGDVTIRLVTPRSPESPYSSVFSRAPGLCALALQVPDLGTAVQTLGDLEVPIRYQSDGLVATDPSATFGIPLEWTS